MGRAVAVSLGALALAIGVLASLPSAQTTALRNLGTTTTLPTNTSSTTSTVRTTSVHVAVLAPAGSTEVGTVTAKLTAAHDILVSEPAIPSSWVSGLIAPVVHYPPGFEAEAEAVASTLGLASGSVNAEAAGTSDGEDVIEVFVPVS